MKQLVLSEEGRPVFAPAESGPLPVGHIRALCAYGAPKHGTELTNLKTDPFYEEYYDEEAFIFKRREVAESYKGHMGLGDMWVGTVAEVAPDVRGWAVGQRVAGYGNLKPEQVVKAGDALPMPEGMHWQQALCYDPLQFALCGVRDGGVRLGDRVLVSGLGAIGQLAAQAARLAGATYVAVADPVARRRQAALENGADAAFDPAAEDAGLLLRPVSDNRGVDVVIETSGSCLAIEQGLRALAYGGTMACVGWYKPCTVPLRLGREGHFNQQRILFSRACNPLNLDHPRWDFERIRATAWQLLCAGRLRCDNILHPLVPFEESDAAYQRYVIDSPAESIKMAVRFSS